MIRFLPKIISSLAQKHLSPIKVSSQCFSSRALDNIAQQTKVGYVTDIEGNFDYWQRYVALSQILFRNAQTGALELMDNCHLVYGGDVCDRGPGDLRVLRDLNALKKKFPKRVHFILGNRDVNKLRLRIELHDENLKRPGKVYWIDQPSEGESQTATERLKWVSA